MILPGATLGVLGGGQLGRMFTAAALRMGYKVVVYDPDRLSPAGLIASQHLCAAFDDVEVLDEFAELCESITIEFENIPLLSLEYLEKKVPLSPNSNAVRIAQNRLQEKSFFQRNQLPTANFFEILDESEIKKAVEAVGFPCILKTAQFGYDGKGQSVCDNERDVVSAFREVGQVACILEEKIELQLEVSVVMACEKNGTISTFPVAQNAHKDGILDTTIVPAQISKDDEEQAISLAMRLASCLKYNGVLAVELFISRTGEFFVNEIAPRPHNSGHYTQDSTETCQFEQQVRMMCELPAGSCKLYREVAMLNLLGDLWGDSAPNWKHVFMLDGAKLHLYGKQEARIGRKMGHINIVGTNASALLETARDLKRKLSN